MLRLGLLRACLQDPWRGTAFTWKVTSQMTVQMLFTTLPVFMGVLRFSLGQTMAVLLPGMLLHALVWNALHPVSQLVSQSGSQALRESINLPSFFVVSTLLQAIFT